MSRKWCKGSKFVFKITESRARRKLTVLWGNVLFAVGESLFPCSANLEVIQHRVEKIVGCQPISSIRGRKYAVKHHYWGTSKSMQIGKEVFYLLSWFSAHLLSLQVFRYWPTRKHGLIKNGVVRDGILFLYPWFSQCWAEGNTVLFGMVYFANKSE